MDLTNSYLTCVPEEVRERYEFLETRNAASLLVATNPWAWDHLLAVLRWFDLRAEEAPCPVPCTPGGQTGTPAVSVRRSTCVPAGPRSSPPLIYAIPAFTPEVNDPPPAGFTCTCG